MRGDSVESGRSKTSYWYLVIPALGVLLLTAAVGKSIAELTSTGGLLEAGLDLILLSVPGLVMLYVGLRLPNTSLEAECYPRIVAWTVGGVVAVGFVQGLRFLHPSVDVEFTFGTQAVLFAVGSIAGLGIGVHEAQALTRAAMLEKKNEQLKRTERRLEDAVAELEASNEELEQFAYAASHDLQEPLRMVTSYLDLAIERYGDDFDDTCQEFIEYAADGADRMSNKIDGLLAYSRVDTQGNSFDAVDLDCVLDDVLTDLQVTIDETDATITREPLPTVEGDARQLQQLFQNLLSNAIEYSGDESPRIHVSSTAEESTWTISVHDDGIGIDPAGSNRIFDIFQRLHSVDEHAGSGIGLAICSRIVERHGGEIWVDSEPDEGSTFSFTLIALEERATTSDGTGLSENQ
ncbi:sensor histidine kinase [Natronorubrum daqingense]|uniref:histidine kinase n=1 Tax=Natronorubrum daqingense TaxID=588898 RepID=A0A1N6YE26_9EURY|nr:ATP-binding protein [Natronorubrum daqingense]APX95695.1 histidine kinase [Natronorubrum daqingense]SIR12838.1 4TM region of histidine kinase [Natronorubrum daqingense]